MAKLNVVRRIIKEDFNAKDRELVGKLAFPINQFIEQVVQAFNKNLTVSDNLPFEYKTFQVSVDANGTPKATVAFKTGIKVIGTVVLRADNVQDTTPLTGAPFMQFTIVNGVVTVNRITGLPADKNYNITVLLLS